MRGLELLAGLDRDRFGIFDRGRTLEAHVLGRRMFETRLRPRRLSAHQIAQFVDADLLGHVVQHEHPERSAQRSHACIVGGGAYFTARTLTFRRRIVQIDVAETWQGCRLLQRQLNGSGGKGPKHRLDQTEVQSSFGLLHWPAARISGSGGLERIEVLRAGRSAGSLEGRNKTTISPEVIFSLPCLAPTCTPISTPANLNGLQLQQRPVVLVLGLSSMAVGGASFGIVMPHRILSQPSTSLGLGCANKAAASAANTTLIEPRSSYFTPDISFTVGLTSNANIAAAAE